MLGADRVFRGDCHTRQVYDEAAKEVAFSVVSGINCKYNIGICLLAHLPISEEVFTYFRFSQQVFLLMGKQAVERPTQ